MTAKRWALLACATFILWSILVYTLGISLFGLLVATGFFAGWSCCSRKIAALEGEVWRLRQHQIDMTELIVNVVPRRNDSQELT